jgi:hypothetical protein
MSGDAALPLWTTRSSQALRAPERGRRKPLGTGGRVTRVLLACVVLLALALIAEAVLDSPVAAWAAIGLFAAVVVIRYEFWPGSGRSERGV